MKRTIAAAMVLFLGSAFAAAQDWPAKSVKIVVPFAAGATPDIVARLIADDLQSRLKQTFIVENRPGASGNTGTDAVVKAGRRNHRREHRRAAGDQHAFIRPAAL
jgi:tripartite-type tricarboxylate transporter receptor subunit TctC